MEHTSIYLEEEKPAETTDFLISLLGNPVLGRELSDCLSENNTVQNTTTYTQWTNALTARPWASVFADKSALKHLAEAKTTPNFKLANAPVLYIVEEERSNSWLVEQMDLHFSSVHPISRRLVEGKSCSQIERLLHYLTQWEKYPVEVTKKRAGFFKRARRRVDSIESRAVSGMKAFYLAAVAVALIIGFFVGLGWPGFSSDDQSASQSVVDERVLKELEKNSEYGDLLEKAKSLGYAPK